jgi:hypothetical protein
MSFAPKRGLVASSRKVDPNEVVFFAPETLQAQRLDEAVKAGASGEEVAALARATGKGEYWINTGETETVDGQEHPVLGDRVQFIHYHDGGTPPKFEDEGTFRVYDGADEDYEPVVMEARNNG